VRRSPGPEKKKKKSLLRFRQLRELSKILLSLKPSEVRALIVVRHDKLQSPRNIG
jgi:hypothetical protein